MSVPEAFPPRWSFDHRYTLPLLLLIAAVAILAGLGVRSPWPPDEPRFAEVAMEMVHSGQWLIPMRGGEVYPDKPPVFMWAIAIFYWLTGNISIAALLPNAICSLITLTLVFRLTKSFWSAQAATIAFLLLLITPQFLIQARFAQIDAMVACWIMIGVYGFIHHFFIARSWGWYYTAWGFMGLGIITKGVGFLPVFLLLPVAWLTFKGQIEKGRWGWRAAAGPLVMLAVIALWLIPMLMYVDSVGDPMLQAYRDNILLKQTAKRYADSWHHIEPWYYYITAVLPVFWLLPLLVIALHPKKSWELIREHQVLFTLIVWALCILAFFSASPGKRGVYMLPALPAVVILASCILSKGISGRVFIGFRVISLFLCTLLIGGGIYLINNPARLVGKLADYGASPALLSQAGWLLIIMGALSLLTHCLWRRQWFLVQFVAMVCVISVVFSVKGTALMRPVRTPENVLNNVAKFTPPESEVAIVYLREQYLLYAKRPLYHFGYHTDVDVAQNLAWQWASRGSNRWVLAPDDAAMPCFDLSKALDAGIAHRTKWLLLGPGSADATCDAEAKGYVYSEALPHPRKVEVN